MANDHTRATASHRGRRPTARRPATVLMAALALTAVSCSSDSGSDSDADAGDGGAAEETAATGAAPLPEGWADHASEVYADDAHWLCRPDLDDDVCRGEDLDATAVGADLSTEAVDHEVAADPPIDCFYVYPTISRDEGINADLEPGESEEVWVTRNQAARFTASCRVFAPVYRQLTLSSIQGGGEGDRAEAGATAYGDVLDAFQHYMAHDNDGRGVVLIGHSQGAGMLTQLISQEIDDEPALRDRIVAAYLIGTTVEVPEGDVVGGTFDEMPLCAADDQTGCVVTYATFAADSPPPAGSPFGRAGTEGTVAGCVNPGALGGGTAELQPYFPTTIPDGALTGNVAGPTMSRLAELDTGWVTMPGYVEAECATADGASYLSVTVGAGADDPRGTSVGGEVGGGFGLHLVDVNLAIGNLVDLAASQGAAHTG